MRFFYILLGLVLPLAVVGCARTPIKTMDKAMRPARGEVQISDDLGYENFLEGLKQHIGALEKWKRDQLQFGPLKIAKEDYLFALRELLEKGTKEGADKIPKFIQEIFEFHEVYGDSKWGEAFITGYFEPELEGSLTPTERFTQPLYAMPDDMVLVDVKAYAEQMPAIKEFSDKVYEQKSRQGLLRGRLDKSGDLPRVVPYFTRGQIDSEQQLKGRKLELVWVDAIDAFFLQIQGSGKVRLPNGKYMRVGYAGQNGHSYFPIGKALMGTIPKEQMSLQKIEQHLRSLTPEQRQAILNQNASYVFFRKLETGSMTFMETDAIAGRSIATDQGFFPKGALAFLTFEKPEFASPHDIEPVSWKSESRFVFDHDTGGAIRGPHRVDLFVGAGESAKQMAGVMRHSGRLYYLVPKVEYLQKKDARLHPRKRASGRG